MEHFEKYSNYDNKSNFVSIHWGHDKPILETELNELQQIQIDAKTNVVRKSIPSGFTQLVDDSFKGEPIIYNVTSNGLVLKNKIAIAPFQCIIDGHELICKGNFSFNKINDYILIDLGNTSTNSTKDSLVYLEVWFESVKGDVENYKYGYIEGDTIGTPAVDERVAEETSRRIVMYWDIRVKQECDFDLYPEGLGYKDVLHYSSVFAKANGQLGARANVNIVFCEAANELFKDETFNHDKNLYVAGRKDYEIESSSLFGRYVYALPMFRIRRRNNQTYDFDNFNGAPSYNKMLVSNDSSKNGDLKNNMRPDRLSYDTINRNDIIDLRKTVSFQAFRNEVLADDTIKDLFSNNLSTAQTPKMRRVQIGNKLFDYANEISSVKLVIPFNGSVEQSYPANDINHPLIYDVSANYDNSINYLGAIINDNVELPYIISDLMTEQKGTIDFFMKPLWNGCNDESQIMITLVNESNSPIIQLRKEKNKLILSQRNYEISNDNFIENKAIANLSERLLIAGRYYHIRMSWTNEPSPVVGQIYLYINSKLVAQGDFSPCYMNAYKLKVGDALNQTNSGFVIENLIGYNNNFELIMGTGTGYSYVVNKFWPMLPKDFMNSDALIMNGFNSIANNFSDNAFTQEDTIFYVEYNQNENLKTFNIDLNDDKYIESIQEIYDMSGNKLSDIAYGRLDGVGTNHITYKPYDQDIDRVIIQCKICLSTGCGGIDMPTELLAAGFVDYDLDVESATNYDYPLYIKQEVSFNDINSEYPRKVSYLKPRKVFGNEDEAYDFTNKYRTRKQCYARLIYYNVSGNGTNQYDIPIEVYGYKVIGIIGSRTNRIEMITKTPSNTVGEDDLKYTVYLKNPLNIGDTITFELACEGYSFDYDLKSKTLMTNMHKCKLLSFVANGIDNVYKLPCISLIQDGGIHGGVLKSVYTFSNNVLDDNGNATGEYEEEILAYHDGEIFYDEHGVATNKKIYNTIPVRITDDSFGTPFITIIFDENAKPRKDVNIQIPIMISYQMTNDDILSIWYKHIPYQGLMTTNNKQVTRIGEWKYFITTLSTGKPNGESITTNIVNELPGGMAYGYKIDNQDIILKNIFSDMNITLNNENVNKKIVFMNDYMLKNNEETCNLVDTYKISKNSSYFQDGNILFENVDFTMYFNDCQNAIKKYIGAYCPVIDENGEVMLLVVGNLQTSTTVINKLSPVYGDLYRIKGRPCVKN